jgi:hypothetical protein
VTPSASYTHTARSLACPLLTLSSAPQFSNGIFRWRALLPRPRVLLPHTYTQDGWFLQPQRRPAGLPRRTSFSRCICRCSRMRARLPLPRVLLPHTYRTPYNFCQWQLINYWDDLHLELIPGPSSATEMNCQSVFECENAWSGRAGARNRIRKELF